MSLRVWLPLNGSLENKGISDITVTNNGATIDNNGKIGKCYSFGNNKYLKIENYTTEFLTYNEFSLSVWFKCTAQNTAHGGSALISSGNWNQAADLLNLALGYFSSDHYTRLLVSGSGVWSNGYSYNFYLNQWYNVVLTSGNGAVRAYVNGELIGDSYAAFKPASLEQTWICIGNGTYSQIFHFYGLMNDIRIYDHCLSQKEIKEISQGLILHYKLDGLSTGLNNLAQTGSMVVYNNYSSSGTTGTLTKLNENFNGAPVYRLVMTPNDTSLNNFKTSLWSHGVYGFRQTFKTNTKYCFWIYYRPISHLDVRVGGTASNVGGWTEIAPKQVSNEWYRVGQFRDGSVTADKTDNIFTSFYTPTATSGQPITIDFASPFLIEGSTDIGEGVYWGLNEINKITDSSGFGHNGTIVGSLNNNTEEIVGRYQNAIYSKDGRTNYIVTPSLNFNSDAVTLNIWFKSNNKTPTNDYHMVIDSNAHRQWYEICVNKSGYLRGGLFVNGTRYADNGTSTSILNGNWHMLTMTYDGNIIKRYVDGIMEKSTAITKTSGLSSPTAITLFRDGPNANYACQETSLNDFRIYATALSAEDIATLYHTSAQVDDLGGVHAFEIEEKQGNSFATELLGIYNSTSANWDNQNNQFIIISRNGISSRSGMAIKNYISRRLIPWGFAYRFTFDIYVPITTNFNVDYNNYSNDASITFSGNDNDNISERLTSSFTVNANTWTTVTLGSSNTNEAKNPNHVTLYDQTNFGIKTDSVNAPVTWYLKNPQWYLVETEKFQVEQNGVFKTNFIKEDDLKNYASFRDNEKAAWATHFIEK